MEHELIKLDIEIQTASNITFNIEYFTSVYILASEFITISKRK